MLESFAFVAHIKRIYKLESNKMKLFHLTIELFLMGLLITLLGSRLIFPKY